MSNGFAPVMRLLPSPVGRRPGQDTAAGKLPVWPNIVPRVDIVIAVVGRASATLDDDLELVANAAAQSPHLLLVFNKIDEIDEDQRAQAVAFAERAVAQRLTGIVPRIFGVSALQRLSGDGSPGDWDELLEAIWSAVAERRSAARAASLR